MTLHDQASQRVESSARLRRHHYVLLDYPWPEGDDHYRWVTTASEDELVRWAENAERVLLKHVIHA
jgi:hypothetical protein